MNKKGDIPVTILVLGVVAICGLTLLSFSITPPWKDDKFRGISLIEKVESIEEEILFYQAVGKDPQTLIDFGIKKDGLLIKEELDKYIIYLEYPQVSVEYTFSKTP